MKKIIFIIFCLCTAFGARAQNEFYIPWPDSNFSLDGITHVIDAAGNLYLLSYMGDYYDVSYFGNTLIKIDRNNNIIWKKAYYNSYPGSQLLFSKNTLFIPYAQAIGYSVCFTTPDTAVSLSSINASLLIDNNTGDTIENSIFYDGKSCGQQTVVYSYLDENRNICNIYVDDSFEITAGNFSPEPANYLLKLDPSLNIISDTLFNPLNVILHRDSDFINEIIYDSFSHNYVIADAYGLTIYSMSRALVKTIPFNSYIPTRRGAGNVGIAYNADYYAINLSNTDNGYSTYSYIIVIAKDGRLISTQPSYLFSYGGPKFANNIILTADNNIWGVTYLPGFGRNIFDTVGSEDTTARPLTLVQMDLYQNVKRKILLGKPNVQPNTISITADNDVIISGTYLRVWDSIKQPDMLYYYRQRIDDIPLLINDKNLCAAINTYPNPTKNTIHISSDDFSFTYGATVELFNVLGQKITTATFDTRTLSFDMTNYPAGTYLLKTRNGNASCIAKIEKE